ncbi:hypothetical protein ABZ820_12515 [Streptomyces diacarni]|uniref:hypothetical protein n=1 Tax=Streptomyces diacarni TaxID=2800381 RepID=UPI0033CE1DB9
MPNIRIQPRPARRTAFARWAVAQRPKVRTVSAEAFAVPPELFVRAPEDILIGALVDGHRYVSPEEDRAAGCERPKARTELLGVARPDTLTPPATPGDREIPLPAAEVREAVPGQPLPPVPEAAYGPDAVPLPAPGLVEPEEAPAGGDGDVQAARYACEVCPRTFGTARGRDTHRRQVHGR